MMSDEEDYMSEKFLLGEDVRPSLIKNHAKRREIQVSLKKLENSRQQRLDQLERSGQNTNEKLSEALKRPLDKDNRGFQLLAKMGYKSGEALGKPTNTTETTPGKGRLLEPINITIKADRSGLGRAAALHELEEKKALVRKERIQKAADVEFITPEEFRKRSKEKANEHFVHGALLSCQKTCENLDLDHGIESPDLIWFWPKRILDASKNDDSQKHDDVSKTECTDEETEEYTTSEKLEIITHYLRTSYLFCFWCGAQYTDDADLKTNCPGLSRDDH